MQKLIVFNNISLDGYFVDRDDKMDWAHPVNNDEEWNAFTNENANNAKNGGNLLFGRITFELMEMFWPTQMAIDQMPQIAEGMKRANKIVVSNTRNKSKWENTSFINGNLEEEVIKLKTESNKGIVVMGSGSIVYQLTESKLIDEYQFIICPIIIGGGRTLFNDLSYKQDLELINSRTFKNGNVLLCYKPNTL
jgi:dihydrofolate reductase